MEDPEYAAKYSESSEGSTSATDPNSRLVPASSILYFEGR